MQRKTKQGIIDTTHNDPVQRRFEKYYSEIMAEDSTARLTKDSKGGYQIVGANISDKLRKKINEGE